MTAISRFDFSTDVFDKTPYVCSEPDVPLREYWHPKKMEDSAKAKGLSSDSTVEACEALLTECPEWQTDQDIRSGLFRYALLELPAHFVEKLLEADPALAHRRILGETCTPLQWVAEKTPQLSQETIKNAKLENGQLESPEIEKACARTVSLARSLLSHGAAVNFTFDGNTPLLSAARKGTASLAKFLILRGAKINHQYYVYAYKPVLTLTSIKPTVERVLLELHGAKAFVDDTLHSKRSHSGLSNLMWWMRLHIWSYIEPEVASSIKKLV